MSHQFNVIITEHVLLYFFLQNPVIRGRDDDFNGADQLTFSLVPGLPFLISSDGRRVTTTANLDREGRISQDYQYIVTVVMADSNNNINTTTLTITVSDINDNAPRYRQNSIRAFAVVENSPIFPNPSATVGQVQAVDDDVPENPQITYFLSGGGGGVFEVNPQTGEIYLISPVNREEVPLYLLNISATDGNLTGIIQVNVTINEANDNSPIFTQNPYLGSIVENLPLGTTVDTTFAPTGVHLQVNATDIDVDPVIIYRLLPQSSPYVPFNVNHTSGFIFTNDTLNREAVDQYAFFVDAFDSLHTSIPALVEIIVLDSNDNPPVFMTDFFNVTIPELIPASFVFFFVEATDNDTGTNAQIVYSILSIDPPTSPNTFNVSEFGGAISANNNVVLNAGDPSTVTLVIAATNLPSSLPPNTEHLANITVEINIDPLNMNAPQFDPQHYNFTIPENENSSAIGSVFATEPADDVGTNITYAILPSANTDHLNFWIDIIVSDAILMILIYSQVSPIQLEHLCVHILKQ